MVKARRNRQPRNWQGMTGVRSHGGLIDAKSKSTPQEIPKEEALKKVIYNLYRLEKQQKKFRRLRDRTIEPGKKSYLEGSILKLQAKIALSMHSKLVLEEKIIKSKLAQQKAQETLREEMRVHQQRLLEIKPGKPVEPMPEKERFKNKPGKGRIVERIEQVGTKRLVRRKWSDK